MRTGFETRASARSSTTGVRSGARSSTTGVRSRARSSTGVRRYGLSAAWYALLALVTTLISWRAIGLQRSGLREPLAYAGDALSAESSFKNVLTTGWYERNPDLGAPWGQTFHDFPLADNLHLMAAHVLGWFTDSWPVAYNLYYLLTFPLAAVAGAWFVRIVGGSRVAAFAAGLLFALAPYHFVRNEVQLYLAAYYVVPLGAGVVYLLLSRHTLWRGPWRAAGTVACLAVLGTASSYYSVFTLLFLAVVVLLLALRGAWRSVGSGVLAVVVLVVVMLANMLPDLLYTHGRAINYAGLTRNQTGTEFYSLKLAQLVLPVQWSRSDALRSLRASYDARFPLPSEQPQLGLIAAAGFLFLLVVVALALAGRLRGEFWQRQSRLSLLNLVAFLIGTVGGLSTLFTLLVTDQIRGWNRIAIFCSLFALASLALLLDRLAALVSARASRLPSVAVVSVGAVLALAVGLWDQIPPGQGPAGAAAYRSDATYVRQVEKALPRGAMVYQEPYLAFPESKDLHRLKDSEPLRPYLHSTDVRWSYGGIKGRPKADWAEEVDELPVPQRLVAVVAAGFRGLHLDRYGYTETEAAALEAEVRQLTGAEPVISPDGRFVFFDLSTFAEQVRAGVDAATLREVGDHAVLHPVGYWQAGFKRGGKTADGTQVLVPRVDDPTVALENPRSSATETDISFTLTRAREGTVRVVWPDGSTQSVTVGPKAVQVSRTVSLRPGTSDLRMPGAGRIRMTGLQVTDPVLTGVKASGTAR